MCEGGNLSSLEYNIGERHWKKEAVDLIFSLIYFSTAMIKHHDQGNFKNINLGFTVPAGSRVFDHDVGVNGSRQA